MASATSSERLLPLVGEERRRVASRLRLWADAGPEGRQAFASALFTKLEVEGYVKMTYELMPDAMELGLDRAPAGQVHARRRWVWSGREG